MTAKTVRVVLIHIPKSERELALQFGLSQKGINKRKNKILKNLKSVVLKLEKSQQ